MLASQVKNSTGDDVREGIRVTSTFEQDLPGSRGVANFALKCVGRLRSPKTPLIVGRISYWCFAFRWVKDAKSAASLSVMSVKKVTRDLTGMLMLASTGGIYFYVVAESPTCALFVAFIHIWQGHACVAAEDDRKFVSIIGFDCRGMDVINWHPEVCCWPPITP